MAESEIVDWFRERSRENGDGYATFLGAGAYYSLPPGDHRFADLARRISDRLHALSGGDFAGHAAGDLRIPDHDLRTDRHGSGQRLHVRRFDRRRRSRHDGGARYRPAVRWSLRAACIRNIAKCWPPMRIIRACRSATARSLTAAALNLEDLEKSITAGHGLRPDSVAEFLRHD